MFFKLVVYYFNNFMRENKELLEQYLKELDPELEIDVNLKSL